MDDLLKLTNPECHFLTIRISENSIGMISDLKKTESEVIKSSYFYMKEMLSEMTNNDIGKLIMDKQMEIDGLIVEREAIKKGQRGDNRKIIDSIFGDLIKEQEKIIKGFKFTLKERNPREKNRINLVEKVASVKPLINIDEFIAGFAGIRNMPDNRNIKCPLPDHKDGTASFSIYPKTASWYCFGCKRGGDAVHFIEFMTGCNRSDAMKHFISLLE